MVTNSRTKRAVSLTSASHMHIPREGAALPFVGGGEFIPELDCASGEPMPWAGRRGREGGTFSGGGGGDGRDNLRR